MKTSEILIAAKALIDEPGKWTQGAAARDANGRAIEAEEPYSAAVCFCSIGALDASTQDCFTAFIDGKRFLKKAISLRDVVYFNDTHTHTHAEVMQMWDRAIELAKAEEET